MERQGLHVALILLSALTANCVGKVFEHGKTNERLLSLLRRRSAGADYDVFHDECGVEEGDRRECGRRLETREQCRAQGCCWRPDAPQPYPRCFLAQRMMKTRCEVAYEDKEDCGYYGIVEGECLVRGCCWAPSPLSNDPPCFKQIGLRLVDGPDTMSGRVEVRHRGEWGTVCDDNFGVEEARVICGKLGYRGGYPKPSAFFGPGTGDILLDGLMCTGNETMLQDCPHNGWGRHNCGHSEDAGVICWNEEPCTSPEGYNQTLRLVNGNSPTSGRVEIYHAGEWGTVCDDNFGEEEARVVCRPYGFETGTPRNSATFGEGNGPIWLDGIHCVGTESLLEECSHDGWGMHDCGHSEDAGVVCGDGESEHTEGYYWTTPSNPTQNNISSSDIRLVNGSDPSNGRLEVFYDGEWGTVCDDGFSGEEAAATCQMLGYGYGIARTDAYFGQGSGLILVDDLDCPSGASNWLDCSPIRWGQHNCYHGEDVGVECSDDGSEYTEGFQWTTARSPAQNYISSSDIRLVNGSSPSNGRLEVFYDGEWGTVCDDGFDRTAATATCRMLGYRFGIARTDAYFGQGSGPILVDDLDCPTGASTWLDCSPIRWGLHNCYHSEDVGVECSDGGSEYTEVNQWTTAMNPTQHSGDIRLVNGSSPSNGRLEVFYDGQWGTVCDDDFYYEEAAATCRMLGYRYGIAKSNAYFGQGSGPILVDDLDCPPEASNWMDCSPIRWGQHNCQHDEDVGVECSGEGYQWTTPTTPVNISSIGIRLVNGSSPSNGRLEVFYDGEWGTVCDDYFFDEEAAATCRMLGYRFGETRATSYFGAGTGRIVLDDLNCPEQAIGWSECAHNTLGVHNCYHSEDIGVQCYNMRHNTTGEITRLTQGYREGAGRLEVLHEGRWGTVCDDGFDDKDAAVACRSVGYMFGGELFQTYANFDGLEILLDEVDCSGMEDSLQECTHAPWGHHDCGASENVYIECKSHGNETYVIPTLATSANSTTEFIRLVGGDPGVSGRLELFYHGTWGTVCGDGFNAHEATAVCRLLGYNFGAASRDFGPGSGPIQLDDVDCPSTATSLLDCTHSPWQDHNCVHSEDVGVMCYNEHSMTMSNDGLVALHGNVEGAGLLTVFHEGEWGTVCDDSFDLNAARVVCQSLGYTFGGAIKHGVDFKESSGSIVLDEVVCSGSEQELFECSHLPWGEHNCIHSEDVGLDCNVKGDSGEQPEEETSTFVTPTGEVIIRLADGEDAMSGRLEVMLDGIWGTVCDDKFFATAATVICRTLGFQYGVARPEAFFGAGVGPIHVGGIVCPINATRLYDCRPDRDHDCSHAEDAGVQCYETLYTTESSNGNVRLSHGYKEGAGLLEVYHDGRWGTVCDDGFDKNAASVVCNELGYWMGGAVVRGRLFAQSEADILLDYVSCSGSEESLLECYHGPWGGDGCSHLEDVAIECDEMTNVIED